jgi:uncharacterized membrane protein
MGLLATTLVGPAAAFYEYSVTGVAAGDVLNIREDVASAGQASSARIVGSIPPDAAGVEGTGVSVEIGGSLWRQVAYGGVTGWVAARYLKAIDGGGDVPPVDLTCGGTEPFWSMTFSAAAAVREDPFGSAGNKRTTYVPAPGGFASGRRHVWAVMLRPAKGSQAATAVFLRTDACSDGMSDLTFPIEFVLAEHESGGAAGATLSGCCHLAR